VPCALYEAAMVHLSNERYTQAKDLLLQAKYVRLVPLTFTKLCSSFVLTNLICWCCFTLKSQYLNFIKKLA